MKCYPNCVCPFCSHTITRLLANNAFCYSPYRGVRWASKVSNGHVELLAKYHQQVLETTDVLSWQNLFYSSYSKKRKRIKAFDFKLPRSDEFKFHR